MGIPPSQSTSTKGKFILVEQRSVIAQLHFLICGPRTLRAPIFLLVDSPQDLQMDPFIIIDVQADMVYTGPNFNRIIYSIS